MNDLDTLDTLLDEAGARLTATGAGRVIPPTPRPSTPVARYAVVTVAAVALVAGALSVTRLHLRTPVTTGAATAPGLPKGNLGPEITYTWAEALDRSPPGRWIIPSIGTPVVAWTEDALSAAQRFNQLQQQGAPVTPSDAGARLCAQLSTNAFCSQDKPGLVLTTSDRQADGQAYLTGIKAEVTVVTFEAGDVRFWSRPEHGMVLFPFTEEASSHVTLVGYAADGSEVERIEADSNAPTPRELRAMATAKLTDASIVDGWFVDRTLDLTAAGPELVQHHGTTRPTGFRGPFAIQTMQSGLTQFGGSTGKVAAFITTQSSDAAEVARRLARLSGELHTQEPEPGITLTVWTSPSVSYKTLEVALATLQRRPFDTTYGRSLDAAGAWMTNLSPESAEPGTPFAALMGDEIGSVDGYTIVARADDVGVVEFSPAGEFAGAGSFVGPGSVSQAILSNPPFGPLAAFPNIVNFGLGDGSGTRGPTLMAVPAEMTRVTITWADGFVASPTLLDASKLAPVKVLVIPPHPGPFTIAVS
jgi:hypothetical protein